MGRFKRSRSKPRGLVITLTMAEIPVWFDYNEMEFQRKWEEAQMSGIKIINLIN